MVDYVLASEFDNRLGTYIKDTYPKDFERSCDMLLADYMIPDGMHRNENDRLIFNSMIPVNIKLI
jgi:hypothetical protein